MFGSLCRIRDKNLLIIRHRLPEDFRDVPRAVTIMDDQTVSLSLECTMSAKQCFRRGPLKKGPRLGIYRCTQEIIRGGVADVELDCRIKLRQFHQIRLEESSVFVWRLLLERLRTQFFHWTHRRNTEADLLREADLQQN